MPQPFWPSRGVVAAGGILLRALVLVLLALPLVASPAAALPVPVPEAPRLGPVGPVHPYHTWETLTVELMQLVSAHPDIARLHSAGKSTLGLDLWVVEIADFQNPDRVPLDSREVVWLDGGTHANEQLGMMLAWLWAEFLVAEYATNDTAKWIVENRHTFILPMVNPDGNHFDGRTNARGVNINRNYPVGWGRVDESPVGNNPGPFAASEPETQAVVRWIEKVRPDYFNSFHTGVDMMLYPTGYAEVAAKDDALFARICAELGETDPAFCGPVYSTIYPASGIAVDTAYELAGSVAWTYEVSPEGFLYASLDDPRIRMDRYWRGVEHAFRHVEKYGAHLSVASVRLLDPGEGAVSLELEVANDGYQNLTGAVVTARLANGREASTVLDAIASGAMRTVRLAIDLDGPRVPGSLTIAFEHAKRLVEKSNVAVRSVEIPLAVVDGRLVPEPTEIAVLPADLPGGIAVPGPAVAVLALGALAAARLRRR